MTHSIFNGELALRGFQLSGKYYCGLSHILCEKDTEHKNFWLKFVICCVVHRKAASHQRLYQKQNDEYFLCVEFCFHYLSRKHYINIDPRRNTKEKKKNSEHPSETIKQNTKRTKSLGSARAYGLFDFHVRIFSLPCIIQFRLLKYICKQHG